MVQTICLPTPLQLFHEPLLKFYFPFTQCRFAVIHLLPILPRFDQFRSHVSPTNSSTYFQIIVQILLCMDSIKDSIKTIREKEERELVEAVPRFENKMMKKKQLIKIKKLQAKIKSQGCQGNLITKFKG